MSYDVTKPNLNPIRFAELDTCYMVTVVSNNTSNLNDNGTNGPATSTNQSLVMPMICPTQMRVSFKFKIFNI